MRLAKSKLPGTVTVIRAIRETDRYGNTVYDWAAADRTEYVAWVEQRIAPAAGTQSEHVTDRNAQASLWLLIVPPDADIDGRDRVEYDGRTFEVIGPPWTVKTRRTSAAHHIEANLRWLEG